MSKSINHQLFFTQPPEVVWEYLTNADLMELWLMKSNFKPIIGYEFQFGKIPTKGPDFDGIVYCKVLEIVPFKKLSYSWKLGPGDGTINIDSIVNWELVPKDNGTLLLLNHNNFVILENIGIFNSMTVGWLRNMNKIAEHLNNANHGTTNA